MRRELTTARTEASDTEAQLASVARERATEADEAARLGRDLRASRNATMAEEEKSRRQAQRLADDLKQVEASLEREAERAEQRLADDLAKVESTVAHLRGGDPRSQSRRSPSRQ